MTSSTVHLLTPLLDLVSDSTEHASTLDDSVATDSEVLVVEVEEDESTSSESLAQESQLEDTELESIIDEGMDDVDANGSVEEATDESVRTDDGEDDSVDASETAPDSPVTRESFSTVKYSTRADHVRMQTLRLSYKNLSFRFPSRLPLPAPLQLRPSSIRSLYHQHRLPLSAPPHPRRKRS